MRMDLRNHPKVVRMASALKADRLRVIGGLWAVWCVFDMHSPDGLLEGYTLQTVDDDLGWRGFGAAMQAVGWLIEDESGLQMPRFDEHNGKSAKRRSQETERKRDGRKADKSPQDERKLSASNADKQQTKSGLEEEEEVIPPVVPRGGQIEQPEIPCPYAQIVALYHEHLPSLPRAKVTTAPRQRGMRSFWGWLLGSTKADGSRRATTADEALQWIAGYFAQASENDFLMGRTPRSAEHAGWRCDIDFLMTPKGIKQVVERTKDAA